MERSLFLGGIYAPGGMVRMTTVMIRIRFGDWVLIVQRRGLIRQFPGKIGNVWGPNDSNEKG